MLRQSLMITWLMAVIGTWDVNADILRVPADYATIQAAIQAAVNGDTVLVAPGTYYENINYRGKGITVASHFILDNNVSHIEATIIDGSQPAHPDTGSCVLITSPTSATAGDTSAALIGFTIRNGSGTRWRDEHGAGYYREGGGILVEYLSPRIMYNLIMNNTATNTINCTSAGGGGIRCGDGSPRITNNVIVRNTALYGPAIVINYCGGVIRNNIIHRNTGGSAYYGGSAVWANSDGPTSKTIENNMIIANTSTLTNATGGILMWGTSCTLRNNILWSNVPNQVKTQSGGSFSASYNTIQGGYSGAGNLSQNPCFADSGFILADGSSCIDAGNPDSVYFDPENSLAPGYALWPSKGGLRNDQGAYGGSGRILLPLITGAWFQLNTSLLNFGTVNLNDSVTGKIVVANYGISPLLMDSVVIKNGSPGVTIANLPPSILAPVKTDTIFVGWKPLTADALSDTVLIYHSDTTTASPRMARITGTVATVAVPDDRERPQAFYLEPNFPNPFNPSTVIRYQLAERSAVSLKIYNLLGQEIVSLVKGYYPAGHYQTVWNGRDDSGKSVSGGVYIYRLQAFADGQSHVQSRKMILIK